MALMRLSDFSQHYNKERMREWYNQRNQILPLNQIKMNNLTRHLRTPIPSIHCGNSFELMPASLLPYRKTWQPLTQALPRNAYLIVTRLDQRSVPSSMLRIVRALRRQGQTVYVLSVGLDLL